MNILQLLRDGLTWTRYYAVNESVGLPEVRILFYEAYQETQTTMQILHPEFFNKSMAIAGATVNLPSDFRAERVLVVDDANCASGYVSIKPHDEWTTRLSNARLAPSVASPIGKKDATTITISPAITSGKMYYTRVLSEADLQDETQDLSVILPDMGHPLLLANLRRLILVRHFKPSDDPTISERQAQAMRLANRLRKRAMQPLEVVEGESEKPETIQLHPGGA